MEQMHYLKKVDKSQAYIYNSNIVYESLDLESVKKCPNVVQIGEHTQEQTSHIGISKHHYVTVGDKRFFVKYPSVDHEIRDSKFFADYFFETLISHVAKKVGINCVEYGILIDHENKSVCLVSPDFGEHITYREMGHTISDVYWDQTSIKEVVNNVSKPTKSGKQYTIDAQKTTEDLTKITCFDYLFSQRDRHSDNIAFLVSEEGDKAKLTLAPLYDNGNSIIDICAKNYYLTPDKSKNILISQQQLLNTQYKDMLATFEYLFSPEHYPQLLEELNEKYGIKAFYTEEQYKYITQSAQKSVQERIQLCNMRINPDPFIPLNVVYSYVKNHPDQFNFKRDYKNEVPMRDATRALKYYYGDPSEAANPYSYNGYIKGNSYNFRKFEYYDQCMQYMRQEDNLTLAQDTKEFQNKVHRVNKWLLVQQMKYPYRTIAPDYHNFIPYLVFDDESIFDKKTTYWNVNEIANAVGKFYPDPLQILGSIKDYYNIYTELKNWCEEQYANKEDLSKEELKELKDTRKLLNKYAKFAHKTIENEVNGRYSNSDQKTFAQENHIDKFEYDKIQGR